MAVLLVFTAYAGGYDPVGAGPACVCLILHGLDHKRDVRVWCAEAFYVHNDEPDPDTVSDISAIQARICKVPREHICG